ncbi:MAG: helix-turn-helix domain-containing protein [Deltaproteobacteria bacterium]|nr:helix-turn-helix domain-containing protein [Deltaproteobacteria bacterium]
MEQHLEKDRELLALIGQKLKSTREARGIALRDISVSTRVNQSFLEKIERGDPEGLPGYAFVKGFIRNYQQAVKLEDQEFEQAVAVLGSRNISVSHLPSADGPDPLERTENTGSLPKTAMVGVLVLLVVWVGYMVIRSGSEDSTQREPAVESAQPKSPTPPNAPAPEGSAKPPAGGQSGAQNANAGTAANEALQGDSRQRLKLTVRGLEPTWLRISIDRAPPMDVLVHPAETVGWDASEEFVLTVGKSQGVSMYLNGEDYPLPQEKNRLVSNLVLNRLTLLRLEN